MYFEGKKVLFLFICYVLINVHQCATTVVMILHGKGESITDGEGHNFANNLRTALTAKNLTDEYNVVEVGLTDNSNDDYNWSTNKSLTFQSDKLRDYIKQPQIWEQLTNASRIVLVGCSQGALLMRGLLWDDFLQEFNSKLDRLITFGGPNSGIFGIPDCDQLIGSSNSLYPFCQLLILAYNLLIDPTVGPAFFDAFFYTAKDTFSPGSYWNDPNSPLQAMTYLALINNQRWCQNTGPYLNKLKRGVVLISFGEEGEVIPTNSPAFGFWDGKGENLIAFNQTQLYLKEWIGLKALNERNAVALDTIANEPHMSIPYSYVVNNFLPYIVI